VEKRDLFHFSGFLAGLKAWKVLSLNRNVFDWPERPIYFLTMYRITSRAWFTDILLGLLTALLGLEICILLRAPQHTPNPGYRAHHGKAEILANTERLMRLYSERSKVKAKDSAPETARTPTYRQTEYYEFLFDLPGRDHQTMPRSLQSRLPNTN
jgi:hypothetical protein